MHSALTGGGCSKGHVSTGTRLIIPLSVNSVFGWTSVMI